MMTTAGLWGIFIGATVGVGIFLVTASLLWPRNTGIRPRRGPSRFTSSLRQTALMLGMKPAPMLLLAVVLAVIGGAVLWAFTGVLALSVFGGVAVAGIPWMWAARKRLRIRKELRNLWPDVVDALISAIRSGGNIPDAVKSLAGFSAPAVSIPAAHFAQDYGKSGNFDLAIHDLKSRWSHPDGDRIVETLRMGRELGGSDITTILASLGSHLRADSALRQEVEARQGWIKLAAQIGLVAPWVVLVILSTRPEAAEAYNTAGGVILIMFGLAISVVAYKIMTVIGRLPEDQRWLA